MPGPCDAEFAYSMNMFAAQLICNVVDIFRGRQKEARVERVLSEACMKAEKCLRSDRSTDEEGCEDIRAVGSASDHRILR